MPRKGRSARIAARKKKQLHAGKSSSAHQSSGNAAIIENANVDPEIDNVAIEKSYEGNSERTSDDIIEVKKYVPARVNSHELAYVQEKESKIVSFSPMDYKNIIIDDEDDKYIVDRPLPSAIGDSYEAIGEMNLEDAIIKNIEKQDKVERKADVNGVSEADIEVADADGVHSNLDLRSSQALALDFVSDIIEVKNDVRDYVNSKQTNSDEKKSDSENITINDDDYEYIVEGPRTAAIDDDGSETIREINLDDVIIDNNEKQGKKNVNSVSEADDEDSDEDGVLPNSHLQNSQAVDSDSDCSFYSDCATEEENTNLSLEAGRGVCIVSCEGGDAAGQRWGLQAGALAALLARPGVAERRAVVVSVAGAFRGGKSFLLDFMLRYLYAQAGAREAPGGDWLGDEREPLRGFSWRNGTARETTGLVLWSQPIPLTLPSGEEVVVLVMDTQGAFDEQSSLRDSSLVFALSTLLASVQVYNVSRRLDECDLQHLQLFTDYAAMGGGVLQDLQILVRDWSAPYEYPYGAEGGAAYLKHKIQIKEEQPQESRQIRQRLMSSFERVNCFLLPHPGLKAATDLHFRGELADLREEFKQSLRELVERLLAPARLRVKAVEGQALRAGELAVFLQAYLAAFRDRVPSPLSALAATAAARWAAAAGAARAALSGPPASRALPRATLRAHLDAARRRALQPLAPLAERAHETAALAQLEEELKRVAEEQIESNARSVELARARARGVWERAARALLADARLCVHPRDLPPPLRAALHAARARFEEDVDSHEDDPELGDLLEELEECYADVLSRLEALNDARNSAGVAAARAAAADLLAPAPCVPAAALAPQHAAARAAAAAAFRNARSQPTTHTDDPYVTQLEEELNDLLENHENQNRNNNEHAVGACLAFYGRRIMDLSKGCWEERAFLAELGAVVAQTVDLFHEKRDDSDFRQEDIYTKKLKRCLDDLATELRERNESMNKVAVIEGLKVFRKSMDNRLGVLKKTPPQLRQKLGTAFDDGIRHFLSKSVSFRSRNNQVDQHLNKLQKVMEDEFAVYREKNEKKLSGEEVAALGAMGAGALVVGALGSSALGAGGALLGAALRAFRP